MLRICLCSWLTPVEFRILAWGTSWSWIEVNPLLCEPQTGSVFKTNKKSGTTYTPHIPNLCDWEEAHKKTGEHKNDELGLFQVHELMHPEWKREKPAGLGCSIRPALGSHRMAYWQIAKQVTSRTRHRAPKRRHPTSQAPRSGNFVICLRSKHI